MPFDVQSIDWLAIGPVVAVAVAALVVLLADLFLEGARKAVLPWLTLAGLGAALVLLLPLHADDLDARGTFCSPSGCSYVVTDLTLVLQLVLLASAFVVVLLSMPMLSVPKTRPTEDGDEGEVPGGEYQFLLLSSVTGAVALAGARDLLTLVIALETLSLPAFALVGLRRDGPGGEAALKFFLLSVAATAVMLFGVSLVYGSTGSVHLARIASDLEHLDPRLTTVAATGAVLTMVGFAFKVAAVPFHFWVPDTYRGAPIPVAAYLSVVSKTAGFAGLLLVAGIAFRPYAHIWGPALAVLAAVTMTAGNVAALRQTDAVRLLAWSSIAQSGYVLVPFGTAAGHGEDLADTLPAAIAYLAVYAVMNLGAFAVVTLVARERGGLVSDHRALFRSRPVGAVAMAFFLLCLAGVPPGLAGLFAKVTVFQAVIDSGTGWLAVVMAVNVVIGLYYYLAWTAQLFAPAAPGLPSPSGGAAGSDGASDSGVHGVGGGGVGGGVAIGGGVRTPAPLVAALVLTGALLVLLSVAPQVVLHVLTVPGLLG
ncbi:NADH-quinone oxidoreductase subunit N [Embleya scabrispora]|uniref:NADH-quinone oxidoreductase subunit N n=1 Tax=Embleya scabrispora TaxID=159449 RepID=UPI000365B87F|nr:NADH-quinone oxidoreductase subunit N [Embleya scabrispora]MYS84473.1 NADH-quinone oxidoreductase subunit N [Streptomyces sp. SID5474]